MIITKEILLTDLNNKKQQVAELMGVIKYTESLIVYLDKEEIKEENKD